MLKRIGLVVLATLAITLVATPATAQDRTKSVMAGVTFTTPGGGVGVTGLVDIPVTFAKFGKFEPSVMVGGFFIKLDGFSVIGGGGGLKWEVPVNDKARGFIMVIAAIGRDDFESGLAVSPGGGILYNIGEALDFFAAVGFGTIRHGGDGHAGAHITFGINKKLK